MQVSDRISDIVQGSDGWGIFYRARELKDAGHDVIELTVGQHDISTDPIILKAMYNSAMAGHTGYANLPGTNELRDKVAERITAQTGIDTKRGNVLITPGGQSALFAGLMTALDPGDKAQFIDPYYATYPGTIRAAGGVPVSVPAFAENGFQPNINDLEKEAKDARALLVNSPNNPTGVVYSTETMQMLASYAQENELWVISDEVYESQIWNAPHLAMRQLDGMADRTLTVGSMSKTYAMTGSRIGWLVGTEAAIAKAIDLATHTTYGVAGFVQDAATFALGLGSDFEAKLAEPFRRRLMIALDLLRDQNHIRAVSTEATMYVMLDIRKTGLSGEDFSMQLLETHNIAVMPGESFGVQAAGHIRVAMTIADDRFAHAFATIIQFAKGLAND